MKPPLKPLEREVALQQRQRASAVALFGEDGGGVGCVARRSTVAASASSTVSATAPAIPSSRPIIVSLSSSLCFDHAPPMRDPHRAA